MFARQPTQEGLNMEKCYACGLLVDDIIDHVNNECLRSVCIVEDDEPDAPIIAWANYLETILE